MPVPWATRERQDPVSVLSSRNPVSVRAARRSFDGPVGEGLGRVLRFRPLALGGNTNRRGDAVPARSEKVKRPSEDAISIAIAWNRFVGAASALGGRTAKADYVTHSEGVSATSFETSLRSNPMCSVPSVAGQHSRTRKEMS